MEISSVLNLCVHQRKEEAAVCTGAQLMMLVNTLTLQAVILIAFDP